MTYPSSFTTYPGWTRIMKMTALNIGEATWYNDGHAPAGENPVRLATSNPNERVSKFYTAGKGW